MSGSRKFLVRLAQAGLVVGFAGLIVYFLERYSADLSNVFSLTLLDIAGISLWLFLSYIAYALSIFLILSQQGVHGLRLIAWIRIYFASRFVNFFVLQGGNLFRMLMLKKRYKFAYSNAIGLTALTLWLNAGVALTLCSAAAFASDQFGAPLSLQLVAFTAVIWLSPLFGLVTMKVIEGLPSWLERVRQHLRSAASVFSQTLTHPGLTAGLCALGVLHFAFFVLVNYSAFHALSNDVDALEAVFFTTAIIFTRYINIVPGNIGLAELVGGLVAQVLGSGFGDGLIVVGIVRVIEVLMIVAVGIADGNAQVWAFLRSRNTVSGAK